MLFSTIASHKALDSQSVFSIRQKFMSNIYEQDVEQHDYSLPE